jgi:hypothetical protein
MEFLEMKSLKFVKKVIITGIFLLLFSGITNSTISWPRFGVYVTPAPVEVITECPGPAYVWVKGHYKVNIFGNLVWVSGHWRRI